jgi:hypothetical protein
VKEWPSPPWNAVIFGGAALAVDLTINPDS